MSVYPPAAPERIPQLWTISMVSVTALVAGCCLWVLWEYASRGDQLGALLLGGWALVITGGIWLAVAVAGVNAYGVWRISVIAPVVFALAAMLLVTGVPQRVGWMLSRPSLESAAASCADFEGSRRFGVYRIDRVTAIPQGCSFSLAGSGLGIDGFAYVPKGDPPQPLPNASAGNHYRHIEGPWYSYANFLNLAA
ncbi:hypothetical protein [Nocardia acidivorans]|uniref:hypothetical protein n=1 Tax=Nocardia acidivorans TaxID=404580 RepID=UPI000A3DE8BA|nr:hypothetical protein [Nocardia acidivorans]